MQNTGHGRDQRKAGLPDDHDPSDTGQKTSNDKEGAGGKEERERVEKRKSDKDPGPEPLRTPPPPD